MKSKHVPFLHKIKGLMQLHRTLGLVWESARSWTVAGLGLMVVQAFLPLLPLYLIKLIVDAVATGINAPDKADSLQYVLLLILLTGGTMLLIAGCRALADIVREHQGQLVTDYVTDAIHRQSAAVELAYYEDARYHDTLYRAQQEAPYRPSRMVQSLTQLGQNGISLLALAGLLFYLHWGVAVVLFIAVLPGIIFKIRHADRFYVWQFQRAETERRVYDYHRMLTDSAYAKEVRLFDLGGLFRGRHWELRATLRRERLRLAKTRSIFDLIAQTGAIAALFAMLAFVVWQTLQGSMTLGDMVLYYQAFQRAQVCLQEIMRGLAGLYEDGLYLNNFYAFLDLKPAMAEPSRSAPITRPMKKGIVLEHVSFRYPSGDNMVLKDIELTIRPGEVVAIVGENGVGKTTLAKLLCRLYDPTDGRITMDGIDFRSCDVAALRREITMIFQDYIHYPLTAGENIRIGDITLRADDERIRQAARQAGIDDVISRLPQGYETILGKHYDNGVELSIGEWQKVALSRAFLRDAQLIILDEPTSAMSVRAEYEAFQSMRELLAGRAALLISHRFSTVRMADMICVLDDGRIVERGSHEALMQLGGRYAGLFTMQARSYNPHG